MAAQKPEANGEEATDTDIRQTATEKNTPEGAQEQRESIEHTQKVQRQVGNQSIRDTSKSRQRERNALKQYRTSDDLPED